MPSQPIQLGVHIAFDDFGTGYASLTYLKKFPLDRLKIDRSFVSDLRAGSDDAAIVGCTTNLGKLLGVSVIAEGIEDPATAELLRTIGCQEGRATISARNAGGGIRAAIPLEWPPAIRQTGRPGAGVDSCLAAMCRRR